MTKRILISIDDAFLERVDERAKVEHRTRSELIREALRSYLKLGQGVSMPTMPEAQLPRTDGVISASY
ncbi:MAG: CopG family ribbon-helix-helix protein [Vampirovibrionales bacterium]